MFDNEQGHRVTVLFARAPWHRAINFDDKKSQCEIFQDLGAVAKHICRETCKCTSICVAKLK